MMLNEFIGSSHIRVGQDGSDCSLINPIAKSVVIEGGIHQFDQMMLGRYVILRRNGWNYL